MVSWSVNRVGWEEENKNFHSEKKCSYFVCNDDLMHSWVEHVLPFGDWLIPVTPTSARFRLCGYDNNNNNNNNDNNNSNNNNSSSSSNKNNSNNDSNIRIERRELSPTRTLKWPGRNRVRITSNTSSAYHM